MLSMSVITSLVRGQSPPPSLAARPLQGATTDFHRSAQGAWSPSLPLWRSELFLSVYVGRVGGGKKSEKKYVSKYFKEKRGSHLETAL